MDPQIHNEVDILKRQLANPSAALSRELVLFGINILNSPDQVLTHSLKDDLIQSLRLPKKYIFGKLVYLPPNFSGQAEEHSEAAQLTGVIYNKVLWAQLARRFGKDYRFDILEPNSVVLTPAKISHAHLSGDKGVTLIALFTEIDPPKENLQTVWLF